VRRRTLLLATLPLPALAAGALPDASPWTALLLRHVRPLRGGQASRVDYAGFARDRGALQAWLAQLSATPRATFDAATPAEQQAFLINAYNAFTVELILSRYPALKSIKDLGSLFESPWKRSWFALLGATRSLDEIEHEWLRKRFAEPRVHAAINCASIGCPALRDEAYSAATLDAQLTEQMQRFLSDRSRNRIEGDTLKLSRIFDWFERDFSRAAGSVPGYLARWADALGDTPADRERVRAQQLRIGFLDYDWALNDVSR
jgi:hypothetical protein